MTATFRRAALIFVRVFIIVFSFIVDVKVRADVIFQKTDGRVEVEKDGAVVSPVGKVAEPLEVQTFAGGISKLNVNSIYLGIGSRSLISLSKEPKFDVSWGTIFVSSSIKETDWISFRTPQGDVVTSGGEFILEVRDDTTKVTVIAGRAQMRDRSAQTSLAVRAGYSAWLGGLLASGSHAKGLPVALDFEPVMAQLEELGGFSQAEWQSRYDHLKPLWKQAVDDVAQENQDQVSGDLQLLQDIEDADQKRVARHKHEQEHLRALFRKKALGVPDENTEDPSDSARAPATSDE